jgi:hypothetical protein
MWITVETKIRKGERQMSNQFKKHSLGTLRPAVRTKDRSPNLIGPLTIQPADIIAIYRHLQKTGREAVTCNIAGWCYADSQGKYIVLQLSPPYVKQAAVATTLENLFEERDEDDDGTS